MGHLTSLASLEFSNNIVVYLNYSQKFLGFVTLLSYHIVSVPQYCFMMSLKYVLFPQSLLPPH